MSGGTILSVEEWHATGIILKTDLIVSRNLQMLIYVTPMLGLYPTGCVFRMEIAIHSALSGRELLIGDTFLNPALASDMNLIRNLTIQPKINLHFVDMQVKYLASKQIRWSMQTARDVAVVIERAIAHTASIAPEALDFPTARAAMIADLGVAA